MRVRDELRKCVVFLGHEGDKKHKDGFDPKGTRYLQRYDEWAYIVTAAHVAHDLGADPFLIRVNTTNQGAENIHVDEAKWFYHEDRDVDVTVLPLPGVPANDLDHLVLGQDFFPTLEMSAEYGIGAGDRVHVVGLFRLFYGKQRILPVVHTGHVALMPGREKIPVVDKNSGKASLVDGYLVELQSLEGLSGSPVFAERTYRVKMPNEGPVIKADAETTLLGVWQAAWTGPPDNTLAAVRPGPHTVPVGMGIVVPAEKVVELFESKELKEFRN